MGELHAWVDESGSDQARDPNTYVLVAAVCPLDAMEAVRDVMRPLRKGPQKKLHWREESKPARRAEITAAVRSCGVDHLVVVRTGIAGESQPRPRRAALKRLLRELDQLQVKHAILESRGRVDDQRDAELHAHLRRGHEISGALRITHLPGPQDPGLWVPDAVAGAVTAARTGTTDYLEMLEAAPTQITMVNIDWKD